MQASSVETCSSVCCFWHFYNTFILSRGEQPYIKHIFWVCFVLFLLLILQLLYPKVLKSFIYRPKFVNRWIWGGPDIRYVSRLNIVWDDVVEVLERLGNKKEYHGIGLLNFNKSEVINWKQLNADAEYTVLHLDYAEQDVTWDSLYPEWIDEEEEEEVPICPSLPKLRAPGKRLDLIAVKLPCRNEGNWSRDVARLHLQLAAASVAASAKGNYPVHLLFITDCFPIPNLFTCKDLVARRGNVWLYRPNLNVIREKIQLPVGSCELALPLKGKGQSYDR